MTAFAAALLFVLLSVLFLPAAGPSVDGRKPPGPTVYGYRIINVYPHDRQAYTQGLIYSDGFLYEGTGLFGASTLRRVQLDTGRVLARHSLDREFFGEGITAWEDRIIQLTWRSGVGFIYDRSSLKVRGTFRYRGEGWGVTSDGQRLIMSDGTAVLRFLDPRSFQETGRLPSSLTYQRCPVATTWTLPPHA